MTIYKLFGRVDSVSHHRHPALRDFTNESFPSEIRSDLPLIPPLSSPVVFYVWPICAVALDRLSRYEATLWHQSRQILLALDALDRRKPQERTRFCVADVHREYDGC